MIDIEKICRTCMKKDVMLVNLFSPLTNENNSHRKLGDALMEVTPLQVKKEDGLPQNLCDECVKILQIMCSFRIQAVNSEIELKKLIILSAKVKGENVDDDNNSNNDFEDMCAYDDLTINEVLPHLDTGTKIVTYDCVICNKKYINYEKYLLHKSVHDEQSRPCIKSNKNSKRKSLLKEQISENCEAKELASIESLGTDTPEIEIKLELENEKHKCSECSISFPSQEFLYLHLKEHLKNNFIKQSIMNSIQTHNEILDNLDTEVNKEIKIEDPNDHQFKCSQCHLVFEKYRSLISHSKKHKYGKNHVFRCDYCDRAFTSKGPLKRHLLLHSVDRPYKCETCTKCYVRRDALVAHMRRHTNLKKYICEHCNKAFPQLCTLKDHIRTHTGETPFLCSECGRGFKNSSNLRQHLARHTGIKPFACNLCPKTFTTKGQMKCHIMSHSDAHPFKCNDCGAAFTKAHSLKKHKLIHLGLKPFACDSCNMRFTARDHLKRHTRTHTGEKPYRCPHCARAFTQSNDLAKHVRVHVGQNIYQCTVCSARFRLMKELRLHYPIHYTGTGTESTTLTDKDTPLVMLKGCSDENTDNNINETATDAQITITFNRNILEKDGTGDITINIGPEKIN